MTGDASQIENGLINLGLNANDAMPEGGILTFHTENLYINQNDQELLIQGPEPGFYIALTVEDTGKGILEEELSHIIEPFYTTKENGKGTGLGLASVNGAVLNHNGNITVESRMNRGIRFTLIFP